MNNGFLTGFIGFSENLVEGDFNFLIRCPICGNFIDITNWPCPCMVLIAPEYGIWPPPLDIE